MRVILAVDGSECSDLAVEEVAERPWPKGTEVKLLAVATSRFPEWYLDSSLALIAAHDLEVRDHCEKLAALLPKIAERIQNADNLNALKIEAEVIEGYPKEAIVEEAERWSADLIVLGSHGYGNLKRLFLGSVAQSVVAHAPCSVEVVRKKKIIEKA